MQTLMQDVRYAVRMLAKSKAFSAIAILSLALGIGANTTIFTVVNAILLHPLPVKDISRVVEVDTVDTKTVVTIANVAKLGMSYPNCQDYARENQVFSGTVCFAGPLPLTWSGRAEPKQVLGQLVTANYFDVLGLRPAVGRFFLPDEDTKPGGNNVAVVSYSLWVNKFGSDPDIVGKVLTLNAMPYTVIGVGPRGFKGTFTFGSAEEVWLPVSMYTQVLAGFFKDNFNDRRFLSMGMFGRLKDGVTMSGAEASLKTIASRLETAFPKDNASRSVALTPMTDAVVGVNNHGQIALMGGLMMAVVGRGAVDRVRERGQPVARTSRAARERNDAASRAGRQPRPCDRTVVYGNFGIGMARGSRGRCHCLCRTRGIVVVPAAVPAATAIWISSFDFHVLFFTLGVSLLTAVLIGIAPAMRVARPNLVEVLNIGGRGGSVSWTRNRFRSLLVVTEIALALVALVGAGLFVRSMQNAQRIDPGFESKDLFVFAFDLGALHYDEGRGQQFFRNAIERAEASPKVASATIASNLPVGGGFARTTFPEGQSETSGYRGTLTQLDDVMPDFFKTLRIPLVKGREFTDLIARIRPWWRLRMKRWPSTSGRVRMRSGKRFHFFGETQLREVVGVVRDTVVNNIGEEPQPLAYLPMTQDYSPAVTMQVRTVGPPGPVIASVRQQVQGLDCKPGANEL